MKILFYGESPVLETGAARVDRHLLDAIVACGHQVEVLGVSHFFGEDYDHTRYPYPITYVDSHEDARAMIEARAGHFDALFLSADMHVPNILLEQVRRYPTLVLGAIDGPVLHADQISALEVARVPAVYSRYARDQVLAKAPHLRGKLLCTPLGCEPETFYPLSNEERREYRKRVFGLGDDTFLVLWANRNQARKDPARALAAFHLFHRRVPNSRLYMHCKMEDVGGNIVTQAILLGLRAVGPHPEVMFAPPDYNEIYGFTRDKLNCIYNAADVCISTSQGEGWGLTTSEAMAAGRPFIGPANTAFFEQLGRKGERGYLAASGGPDLWSVYYGRDDSWRPITSASDLAARLEEVYRFPLDARARGARARKWTQRHTWARFERQWREALATFTPEGITS